MNVTSARLVSLFPAATLMGRMPVMNGKSDAFNAAERSFVCDGRSYNVTEIHGGFLAQAVSILRKPDSASSQTNIVLDTIIPKTNDIPLPLDIKDVLVEGYSVKDCADRSFFLMHHGAGDIFTKSMVDLLFTDRLAVNLFLDHIPPSTPKGIWVNHCRIALGMAVEEPKTTAAKLHFSFYSVADMAKLLAPDQLTEESLLQLVDEEYHGT